MQVFYNTSGDALNAEANTYGSVAQAQSAGYEVVAAPVVRLTGLENVEAGDQIEIVMTNGSGSAKWGNKFDDFETLVLDASTGVESVVVQNRDNSLLVTLQAGVTSVSIPFIGTVSSNEDPLMATVKPVSGDNNNIVTSTVTAATVSDSEGGSTTTTIDSTFTAKDKGSLKFDILTTENNDNALGNDTDVDGFEGLNADNVIYTVDSDYKFTTIKSINLNEDTYTDVTSATSADYGLDVEVYAKIGSSDNKLDVVYVVNNRDDINIASSVLIDDVYIYPTSSADLGEDVYMSVNPKGDSDITKQSSLKVGTYTDYAYSAGLYNSSAEIPTLPAGSLGFAPEITSGASVKDTDLFDTDEVSDITVEDDFDDIHATEVLKIAESISGSMIDSRDIEIELPEEVQIVGFEIVNSEKITWGDDITTGTEYYYTDLPSGVEIEDNTLVIDGTAFTTTGKANFAIKFFVAADANFAGDVTATVSGGALAGETLEPVTLATMAPAVTLDTTVTNVKAGTQSTTTADITLAEVDATTFKDGETVYISIDTEDTATLANAIKFVDADVEVTEGDLDISDVKVTNSAISFKVKGESTDASTIELTNVKVSTAYGLPETNVAPFEVVVTTDAEADEFTDEASTIGYGSVRTSYINIKEGSGALSGDVVEVQPGSTTYLVNGEERTMDVAPFIDATTQSLMVPVRFIADGVGLTEEDGNLIWSANNKTVIIRNGSEIIEFPVGANFYRLNGIQISNENNAITQIVDGRTFVPFRTMGNALGIPVSWDADSRTAQYN